MTKITCEIVKDLLPLYVDDVLSEDSRMLVEEHIDGCSECRSYCEKLKDTGSIVLKKKNDNEKKTIKGIRKKIITKRIRAVCLTAIIVAAVATGLFYGITVREKYLPYEKTGLYAEDDALHTKKPYYCYYGFESPEEGTVFIYMTTTVYENCRHQEKDNTVVIFDSDDGENELSDNQTVKEVYYIPQEYAKLLRQGYWLSAETEADYIAKNQEKTEELKAASELVWKAD